MGSRLMCESAGWPRGNVVFSTEVDTRKPVRSVKVTSSWGEVLAHVEDVDGMTVEEMQSRLREQLEAAGGNDG